MKNTFFIADTHFGHKNIIAYENRPFRSVEEMDKHMMDKWNEVVNEKDDVYILGDFSYYDMELSKEILNTLKGNKFIILGNHDEGTVKDYYDMGFKMVYDCPIVYQEYYILSHKPAYINPNMPYVNIFGHVHSNPLYNDYSNQSFCVSVERIGYCPINFNDIKKCINI